MHQACLSMAIDQSTPQTVISRSEIESAKAVEAALRIVLTQRSLIRPKTNIGHVLLALVPNLVLLSALLYLQMWISSLYFYGAVVVTATILDYTLRRFLVKVIECYQHYAKEETRRRCLCLPSCSQYAIIVLNQKCLFVAVYKISKRLFKTCRGWDPKLDLP